MNPLRNESGGSLSIPLTNQPPLSTVQRTTNRFYKEEELLEGYYGKETY
jgi:hypothetical protein